MHARPSAEDLALFGAIDRAGSLSGAAAELGVNQSTVSRRLGEVEERLGAPLFVRTRDGVVATDLGARWRGPARDLRAALLAAGEALDAEGSAVTGRVRLTTTDLLADHVLIPAVGPLLARHPRLRLEIVASLDLADLPALQADIAVRFSRPETGDLVGRRLLPLDLAAFAAPGVTDGADFRRWPWVGWADPARSLGDAAWFEAHGITPRLAIGSPTSLLAAVRAGVGAGILPRAVARLAPELVALEVPSPTRSLSLWAVTHRALRPLPRIDAVWTWLAETLRGAPDVPPDARSSAL